MLGGLAGALAAPSLAAAADQPFDVWLDGIARKAAQQGIRRETLQATLGGIYPLVDVLDLDRSQPEHRATFVEYRANHISDSRIEQGRALLEYHRDVLADIRARFRVPPEIIVALWGLESSYGERPGGFPVIPSLATLAYDGRRAAFFEGELLHALAMVDRGSISPAEFLGSWAGASGQCQFMPSTYVRYAVDYDRDGRADIWTSRPDVFASIANYLGRSGWADGYIWGREVIAPSGIDGSLAGLDRKLPLAKWQALGVRAIDGSNLPKVRVNGSLLLTDDGEGPAFLVYENFRTLMTWNRSTYFALTAGLLMDSLGDG